jgi:hypothetical protein
MANTNPTETRIATIFKDANGILIITMKDCDTVDEYDVIDINLVIRIKTEKKPVLKLLDTRAKWRMDKKAKDRSRVEDRSNYTKARAIVVSNGIKASLYKFLQEFNKKTYPQKFFTDKEEAYNWLLTLK